MTSTTEEKQTEQEQELLELYTGAFPLAARYISKMGGSLEEAKDTFHDAMVIYCEKNASFSKDLRYSKKAYLFGITKNLWHYRFREKKQTTSFGPLTEMEIKKFYVQDPVVSKISDLLDAAGKKCMQLLTAFYYKKLSMHEIAERFGFSGERSATVQKYKCLEKVKSVVKQKSLTYEEFFE